MTNEEWTVFRLGPSQWTLPIQCVRHILPSRPVTRLPGAAPHIRGLIAWHARVLPLLAAAPDKSPQAPLEKCTFLIVERDHQQVALAVDEVLRISASQPGDSPAKPLDLDSLLKPEEPVHE